MTESRVEVLSYPMILPSYNLPTSLRQAFVGLILSICAVVGDLTESITKRHASVKDSGKLLPGHGGVLDRMDSMLFSAIIYYWMCCFDEV